MELIIAKNAHEGSLKAAKIVENIVKEKPTAVLGLATGSTPVEMYTELIRDHKENGTSYKDVKTYNLDEYIGLEPTHHQSYRYFMNENLFNGLDIDINNTHVPSGMGNGEANAKAYDQLLDELGGADVQILGIGTNGHIAFNEPGTDFSYTTHVVDLVPETIAANARFFDSIDDVPKTAVSMGIASIMKAKKIILLAFGENKAKAIRAMFEDAVSTDVPATALQNHPNVTVVIDEAAAMLLTNK